MITMLTLAIQNTTAEVARRNAETIAILSHTAELMTLPRAVVRDRAGRVVQLVPQYNSGQTVN